jgi:hypothetical protein
MLFGATILLSLSWQSYCFFKPSVILTNKRELRSSFSEYVQKANASINHVKVPVDVLNKLAFNLAMLDNEHKLAQIVIERERTRAEEIGPLRAYYRRKLSLRSQR